MRLIKHLLIIILLTDCSGDKEAIQRLKEFEYPLDSLNSRKLFVYKRTPDGEYHYIEQIKVRETGTDFLLQEFYDTKHHISSDKYEITDNGKELIESYLYWYTDSLFQNYIKEKFEIHKLKNILDKQKHRGIYTELGILINGDIKTESITKETFMKEDKLTVMDQTVDVLVFTQDIKVTTTNQLTFTSSESVYTGEIFYAKNLGVVKYSTNKGNEIFEWELVNIKNVE